MLNPPKPCRTSDGREFPSAAQAARAIGCHRNTVLEHMERYGEVRLPLTPPSVPCRVKGKVYPSVRAAAKALRIRPHTLSYHLERWGHADRVGTRPGNTKPTPAKCKPVQVGSYSWPSQAAASRALGVTEALLSTWLSPKASMGQRDKLVAAVMVWAASQRRAA